MEEERIEELPEGCSEVENLTGDCIVTLMIVIACVFLAIVAFWYM